MKYLIITNPEYTNCVKIGILLAPDNETLRFFLASLRVQKFPNYIASASKSNGFGEENASVKYFNEMDWEDKDGLDIKESDVNIYVYDGNSNEIVVNENLFDRILYDYSKKLLEVYTSDKSLRQNWALEMDEGLTKLKEKILKNNIGQIDKIDISMDGENKEYQKDYEKIQEIIDALQIASGQTFALNKTKELLDTIDKFGKLEVISINSTKVLNSFIELRDYIITIDSFIDIKNEKMLSHYFEK